MGIGNPFKSIERSIKRGINSLGDDVKRGVNSLGNDVKNGVRSAGNSVKGEVVKAGQAMEREIEEAAATVKRHTVDEIEALAKKAKTEIEDLAEEAEDRAEEAIQMVLRELQKALTAEGLRKIRGIVHSGAQEAQLDPKLAAGVHRLRGRAGIQAQARPGDARVRELLRAGGGAQFRSRPLRERAADLPPRADHRPHQRTRSDVRRSRDQRRAFLRHRIE